jgi:hypothetical protein
MAQKQTVRFVSDAVIRRGFAFMQQRCVVGRITAVGRHHGHGVGTTTRRSGTESSLYAECRSRRLP